MTTKIPLPGGEWAELRDTSDLTGADQDAYWDAYDEIMNAKPRPEPKPDPANPSVMLEPPRPRFTNADGRVMRDKLIGMLVTSWSFDHPLPVTTETRQKLPLPVLNALYRAIKPMDSALSGTEDEDPDVPKPAAPSGTGGSSDTSADGTENPLQESPGDQSVTP
jgi:hypothetical protein